MNQHKLWKVLLLFRFILTFLPQFGYVHPDEFFQTVEVVAGETLKVQADVPWEFTTAAPIRSYTVTYAFMGVPIFFVRLSREIMSWLHLQACSSDQANLSTINKSDFLTSKAMCAFASTWFFNEPYFTLVLPRAFMLLLSLLLDYSVAYCCKICNRDHHTPLNILASSQVMLIYQCRTLTNSLETILFALLLLQVLKSMHFIQTNKETKNLKTKKEDKHKGTITEQEIKDLGASGDSTHGKYEETNEKCFKKPDNKNANIPTRQNTSTNSSAIPYSTSIAVILALGIFNRPTFLAYSIAPCMVWLLIGKPTDGKICIQMLRRAVSLFVPLTFCSALIIISDTIYSGRLNINQLLDLSNVPWRHIIVSPLNFILYNIDTTNLEQHGLHPRYLHLLINIPILFGVLGIAAETKYIRLCYQVLKTGRISVTQDVALMHVSWLAPVLLMSILPHQEPRFLLPCIIPLAFLSTDVLFVGFSRFAKVYFVYCWILWNAASIIWTSFLHQGGVVPSMLLMHRILNAESGNCTTNIIYFHTYMPPKHLLMLPKPGTSRLNPAQSHQPSKRLITFTDLAGKPVSELEKILEDKKQGKKCFNTYLIMPISVKMVTHSALDAYNIQDVYTWKWHVSVEDPPFVDTTSCYVYSVTPEDLENIFTYGRYMLYTVSCFYREFVRNMGLGIYHISPKSMQSATVQLAYAMR